MSSRFPRTFLCKTAGYHIRHLRSNDKARQMHCSMVAASYSFEESASYEIPNHMIRYATMNVLYIFVGGDLRKGERSRQVAR